MLAEDVVFLMMVCGCVIFSIQCSHLSQAFIHIHFASPGEGRLDYYMKLAHRVQMIRLQWMRKEQ